jgi:predicted transcriptional regulator
MTQKSPITLSRRERQIMDIIYRRGRASAAEVLNDLPDSPSYSAVRALMRILEEKGHLTHEKAGARYIYLPTQPRQNAGKSALKQVFQTFFDSSVEKVVAALLDVSDSKLSDEDLERLAQLIERARIVQTSEVFETPEV